MPHFKFMIKYYYSLRKMSNRYIMNVKKGDVVELRDKSKKIQVSCKYSKDLSNSKNIHFKIYLVYKQFVHILFQPNLLPRI